MSLWREKFKVILCLTTDIYLILFLYQHYYKFYFLYLALLFWLSASLLDYISIILAFSISYRFLYFAPIKSSALYLLQLGYRLLPFFMIKIISIWDSMHPPTKQIWCPYVSFILFTLTYYKYFEVFYLYTRLAEPTIVCLPAINFNTFVLNYFLVLSALSLFNFLSFFQGVHLSYDSISVVSLHFK